MGRRRRNPDSLRAELVRALERGAAVIAKIVWTDAAFTGGGWLDLDDVEPRPLTVASVGWVSCISEKFVVLCQSVTGNGQAGEMLTLPWPLVEEVQVLFELES